MTEEMSSNLLEQVLGVLRSSTVPVRASDIARRLDSDRDLPSVRREVNRLLYGPLQAFAIKDEQDRWTLVRDPEVSRTTFPSASPIQQPLSPPLSPDMRRKIDSQLEEWKKDLINFGKSNKLLYFNSSRRTRLRLTAPSPELLYEGLVLREKKFTFAVPAGANIDLLELEDEPGQEQLPERRGDVVVDYETSSATDVVSLQRKLFRLRSDARSTLNEQGINTLHVGLGILKWLESGSTEDWILSPLVLVPATLDREKNGPYELGSFEGDVVVNPTLVHRLRHDFDLELPSFDPYDGFGEQADPLGYLAAVTDLVRERGWYVTDDVWLTHFSFEKLVMFEDLSRPGTTEAIAENEVLAALTGVREIDEPGVSFEEVLQDYELPELYPVVDADSSQLQVLARARGKSSMVVQGPPGTGKSQTIVNLIAQSIRDGLSVLFVSEKKAALEVVYRRLRDAGLDDLCLELHSHKANKREVVRDLYLALSASSELREAPDRGLFEERRQLRQRLDAYVDALHKPRGKGERRAYEVQGELVRLSDSPFVTSDLPVETYVDLTRDWRVTRTQALEAVSRTGVWGRQDEHPWSDFVVTEPAFAARLEISPQTHKLKQSVEQIIEASRSTRELVGVSLGPTNLDDATQTHSALERIGLLTEPVKPTWLTTPREQFRVSFNLATQARDKVAQAAASMSALEGIGAGELVDDPSLVLELHPRFQSEYQRRLPRLSGEYRRDRRRVRAVCGKLRFESAARALESAKSWLDTQSWLQANAQDLQEFVGYPWPQGPAEAQALVGTLERVLVFRESIPDDGLAETATRPFVDDLPVVKEEAGRLLASSQEAFADATLALEALSRWLPNGVGGLSTGAVPLDELAASVAGWTDFEDLLDEWTAFGIEVRNCDELGLTEFLEAARKAGVASEALAPALDRLVDTRWISEVYRAIPALGQFAAKNHRATIEMFCRLDRELVDEARRAVRYAASESQKGVRVAARFAVVGAGKAPEAIRPARDECRLINKEYLKKTRHLPLRRLLPNLPNTLPAIKPCLLMSPLSVASYLPRDRFEFDVVIFDEASQVLPADAVGAMLRAKQVIVLGDSKQLPPTDFFRKRLDDEGDEVLTDDDEDDTPTFASILEACATALPEEALRWHYRSKDERLIAFSNRTFYADRPLITFPSPDLESHQTGVQLDYVANGLYDRGGSRTNIEEARRVVDRIIEHFETHGWERSLGIITLGIAQRDVIELELRRRLLDRPELAPFLAEQGSEPFFIKNLETVQGDERDDIILSLGYGPSEPGGKPALGFGPVSAKGGERRLNVAVTRAKYSMRLVTSMRPDQLDRTALLANEGPKVLGSYVRYAERGGRFEDAAEVDLFRQPESDFELGVRNALIDLGYMVDSQVGVSQFRIDLAVRHPDKPTRYVLGIECDGATYHRAAAARDRDRLRQEVLEEHGWRIYRLWSTDWIQNPERALQLLVQEIERVRGIDQTLVVRESAHVEPETLPVAATPIETSQAEALASPAVDLPAPFIEEQQQSMIFELARLERQIRGLTSELADIKGQPDKGYSGDVVEQALEQRVTQVRAALRAIEDGTYGVCRRCGRQIEIERLEAVPSASLCRECSLIDS